MVHSKMDRISRLGAYGILVHDSKVLLTRKKSGPYKGLWDLPGGAIEFGEAAENALKREFLEELGCNVQIIGDPMVWENIFKHHGIQGHEIIFAFPIHFDDAQIYAKNRFQIFEARGSSHWVEWIEIERFKTGEFSLFPPALKDSHFNGTSLAIQSKK